MGYLPRMGLAHELVTVEWDNGHYLLDWEFSKIKKRTRRGFKVGNKKTIQFDNLTELAEREVFERIQMLRSAKSFLGALASGQCLYQRYSKKGILEIYVKFDPKTAVLDYWFVYFCITGLYHCYLRYRMFANGESQEEIGLAYNKTGFNFDTLPIATVANRSQYKKCKSDLLEEFHWPLWHHYLFQKCVDKADVTNSSEVKAFREKFLHSSRLADWNEEEQKSPEKKWARDAVAVFDEISERGGEEPGRLYLDAVLFLWFHLYRQYPSIADLQSYAEKKLKVSNLDAFDKSLRVCFKELAEVLDFEKAIEIQHRLHEEIVHHKDLGSYAVFPPKFFDYLSAQLN